jgi:predicted outer membrane protein
MQKWTVVAAAGVLILSFASVASAQLRRRAYLQEGYPAEQYQRGKSSQGQPLTARRSQRAAGPMEGVHLTDEQLANWLLVDNRAEIQLARIAQERASCEEVQDFAKRMIDDHAEMVEKLQRFASTGRNSHAATQNGQQAAGQGGELNFVRLKQQLGQQCVTSAERELEEKEGEEFDKCFMGMQIGLHMHMLDTLKVFSRYASPQLDEVIEDGEQATQEHLDKAKELMKDHEGKEGKNRSSASSDRSSSSLGRSSGNRDTSRDADNDRD